MKIDNFDDATDEERLIRLDRLEKLRRAERRFDPFMVAFAKKEWRRVDMRNYVILIMISSAVYAFWRWF